MNVSGKTIKPAPSAAAFSMSAHGLLDGGVAIEEHRRRLHGGGFHALHASTLRHDREGLDVRPMPTQTGGPVVAEVPRVQRAVNDIEQGTTVA